MVFQKQRRNFIAHRMLDSSRLKPNAWSDPGPEQQDDMAGSLGTGNSVGIPCQR